MRSADYGRLVPYGDRHALAEAIVAELKNPQKGGELGSEYRLGQFKEQYLRIFEEELATE
jgi:hypothetical protein